MRNISAILFGFCLFLALMWQKSKADNERDARTIKAQHMVMYRLVRTGMKRDSIISNFNPIQITVQKWR